MEGKDALDAWWEGAELPNVRFRYNDTVKILAGPDAGMFASVISLQDLGEDPTYVVELTSGFDRVVADSCLAPDGPDVSLPTKDTGSS